MPLANLLYRCPLCPEDPLRGRADEVLCPSCGRAFRRGPAGGTIRIEHPDGSREDVAASRLVAAIARRGGPLEAARGKDGAVRYRAAAVLRRAEVEEPVHLRGELLGFAERFGDSVSGTLEVDDEALTFHGEGPVEERWAFVELGALQSSSSTVQLSLPGGAVVQLRFVEDSPKRWEDLLKHLIRQAWGRAGKGEITEFQPRIATR